MLRAINYRFVNPCLEGKKFVLNHYSIGTVSILCVVTLCYSFSLTGCQPQKQPLHKEQGAYVLLEGGYDADYSPDGKSMVYTRSFPSRSWKENLYVLDIRSGEKKQLTRNIFWDGEARYSPDGKSLVFTTDMVKLKNIVLHSLVKNTFEELTKIGAYHPCWSPDNSTILFVSKRSGHSELWTIRIKDAVLRQVTHLNQELASPAWDPLNESIVFCLNNGKQWDLWQLKGGITGRAEPLFNTERDELYPRWSRSGKYLTFCSFNNSAGTSSTAKTMVNQIWLISRTHGSFPGTVQHILTALPGEKLLFPSFSSDEKRIIYSTNYAQYRWDICTIKIKPSKTP